MPFESTEKSNGRITIRKYDIILVNEDLLENLNDWAGLKSVGKVETTTFKNGKEFFETRLYLLSYLSAKVFANAARGHWGIEIELSLPADEILLR